MKHVILILFLFCSVSFSCSEDDDPSGNGCLTGVNKSSGQRELIRCCTKEEYLAGSNVSAGGTANWNSYTGHSWAVCDDCK